MAHGSRSPRILSIYDSFFLGGARLLHSHVVEELHSRFGQEHSVLSLTDRVLREGSAQLARESLPWKSLEAAGVSLTALRREPGDPYGAAEREAIETAVADADLILVLKEQALEGLEQVAALGSKPVILSLHRSDPKNQGRGPGAIFDALERGDLTEIVCCADSTRDSYSAVGIPRELLHVVRNGIDLERFRPRPEARLRLRSELGIPQGAPVVLIAARYDAMKNIELFVGAAERFLEHEPDAHFVLCGAGMGEANGALVAMIADHVAPESVARFHLLGPQSAMEDVHNLGDIIALTSAFGEAAPLCLMEGMATGAVPVATDVGDCRRIVGDPRLISGSTAAEVASSWSQAWTHRDEHRSRILAARGELADRLMVQCYADLIGRALKS